jgi:tetraacyldisaccharide 4'-kinase
LLLLPLAMAYELWVRARNLLYLLGWARAKRLPCAVVSIGNLTVGGTGKTPATLWLAQALARAGHRVAILSRGYKGSGKGPVVLEPGFAKSFLSEEEPFAAGDEPVMMARLFGQRVGVGRKRHEVGELLLRERETDVLLLDDGFQHRQLERDLDILLLGSDWQGSLLPAGPFREPRGAWRRADFLLVTGAKEQWARLLRRRPAATIFYGAPKPKALLGLDGDSWKEYPLSLLDRSKILAVSAIADPAPFYRAIHDWEGEIVDSIEFADHHFYTTKDWQRINRAARNVEIIVTTEKDILKLVRFPFARQKLLALRVEMAVENGEALVAAVERAIDARRKGA